ncbi:MAG TPA: type II toxin-antitoxin system HicA family toxin [Verrucomicrobia bacterium]|nr:type II toxin-antitoxin system HicA family toxin [Verrucomicrobiota bacterium]
MPPISPLHYLEVVKIFEAAGCVYSRTKGDHLIYHFPGAVRPVVIPKYKEVPVFVIKNNMHIIGMTSDKFSELKKSG